MRIATLIIGLLMGLILLFQSWTVGVFGGMGAFDDATESAGAAGTIMALAWFLASALVIPLPLVSTVLFGLTVLIGLLTPTGDFADLRFHGVIAIGLTVMAFFGWRGKKKAKKEQLAERRRQEERDARLESLLTRQQGAPTQTEATCRHCGQPFPAGARF